MTAVAPGRRQFVGALLAATWAPLGGVTAVRGLGAASREVKAIGAAPQWLNSPPLTTERLANRVLLVEFCTYTCINWMRTLPYVRAWARKYRQSLTVIGVHTPEFAFERDIENVRRAMAQMQIDLPIVIDNDSAIWRAFANQYWPALYLLDGRGRIRHHQFGEGDYQASERAIQRLIADAGATFGSDLVSPDGNGVEAAPDWMELHSPETYIGYERAEHFASREPMRRDRPHGYRAPSRLAANEWSLSGDWTIGKQSARLNASAGQIQLRFHARDVHLVMGPARATDPVRFRVSIDGQPLEAVHGLDVDDNGSGTVREPRLYQLVRQRRPIADRTFTIEFLDAGVEAYSFTFG